MPTPKVFPMTRERGKLPADGIRLSLIICSRNRADQLTKCLSSIPAGEMRKAGGELILVDSASHDNSTRVMQSYRDTASFPVEVVRLDSPGLGRARNAGIERARADVIAFTDDDCYLSPHFPKLAVGVFDMQLFRYCGGRILLYDETDAMYCVNYSNEFKLIPSNSFIPAGLFQGANLVVHREVFKKAGLFHPLLGAGTKFRCEDVEFVARASAAGFAGAHVPQLIIYHHHGRKPGRDINILKKENDEARGCYYVMMIFSRHYMYLKWWLKVSILTLAQNPSALSKILRETKGGCQVAVAKMMGRLQ